MSSAVNTECDSVTDALPSAVRDAVTTTVSFSGAMSSRKSAVAGPVAATSAAAVTKPSRRAVRRWGAGSGRSRRYRPSSPVDVVDTRRSPRRASTVAPGSTPPDESVTRPVTAAGSWAVVGAMASEQSKTPSGARYRVMVTCSFLVCDIYDAGPHLRHR